MQSADRQARRHVATRDAEPNRSHERTLLVALAVCCAVPMVAIIAMTSTIGVALGPVAAISLGLVAAMACAAVMVQRHRGELGHGR